MSSQADAEHQRELDKHYRESLEAAGYEVPDGWSAPYRDLDNLPSSGPLWVHSPRPSRLRRWLWRPLFEIACGLVYGFQWLWDNAATLAWVFALTAFGSYWVLWIIFAVLDRSTP